MNNLVWQSPVSRMELSESPFQSYGNALSNRERQIAALVATGASNKEIARELAISSKTVRNTLTRVFVKTNTRSRTELAVQIVQSNFAMQAR